MDPTNSQILYASTYQRRRTACCMNGGGPGSGIWKSTDGGETWTRLKAAASRWFARPHRPRRLSASAQHSLCADRRPGAAGGRGGARRGAAAGAEPAGGRRRRKRRRRTRRGSALNTEPTGLYRSDDARRDLAEGEQRESAADVFQPGARRSERPRRRVPRRRRAAHQTLDGGKTIATDIAQPIHDDVHAIWIDPANSQSRHHRQRRRPRLVATIRRRPGTSSRTFRSASSTTSATTWRRRSTSAAACRTTTTGAARARCAAPPGIANHHWTTIQGGDGFVVAAGSGRFPRSSTANRRTATWCASIASPARRCRSGRRRAARRAGVALALGHADRASRRTIRRSSTRRRNKVFRSADRGLSWDRDQRRPDDATPTATTSSRWASRAATSRIAQDDGIVGLADDRLARRVAEAAGPALRRHRRRQPAGDRATAARPGRTSPTRCRTLPKGMCVSEVAPSRFDEGTVYATFDGHRQNDFETYIYASNDFGQTWRSANGEPEGRGRQDDDRRPEEPGRALPRHRDRAVRVDRSRRRAGPRSRRTCRRSASTRSRCIRATTR